MGIAVYFVVAILPWTHGVYLLSISLTAWMLTALMFIAPLLSLAAAGLDERDMA